MYSAFCMFNCVYVVCLSVSLFDCSCISKWRHERSSRLIRNLSNYEREAWKKFRLQRDSNPWPLRYRCSALPTELWSHNCWEQVNFSGSIMPLRVIQHYTDWVCTVVMSKWRHERSSRLIRNLSNCEREAWKNFRLQRDSNPWPSNPVTIKLYICLFTFNTIKLYICLFTFNTIFVDLCVCLFVCL